MSAVTVREATTDDVQAYLGGREPPATLLWTWVGEIDGEVKAIGGVAQAANGRRTAWFDLEPEMRAHKFAIVRASKRFMAEVRRRGGRYLVAQPGEGEPGAERWLASLGFRPANGGAWIWQR